MYTLAIDWFLFICYSFYKSKGGQAPQASEKVAQVSGTPIFEIQINQSPPTHVTLFLL